MDLIVTHIGADFDALASLVAAKKLNPQAKAVLPGSPEKAVRDFLSLWQDELRIDAEKDIDFSQVEKLIIVETRIAPRIGKAQELVGKKGIQIEIYDHHPRTRYDIKAGKDIFKPTGATVTILLQLLRKKKIGISPLEATVMALGIYEDTGSLTFQATTKQDIDMVGYLFSQGVSLNVVSSYLKRELTHQQLGFLSELINKTQAYLINGVWVGVVAVEPQGYVEDFSLLVHKLIEVENFNVIFAFAKNDSRIQMVARSNLPYVRVDEIAESFGGGGHPYAASAVFKDIGLDKALSRLLNLLKIRIRPKIFAEDITPSLVKTVGVSQKVTDTKKIMNKFGLDAVAVFDANRMAGIIGRADVERAIRRGYGHSRIKGYMKTHFVKIASRTPLHKIQQIISREKIGYLPVFKSKRFIGLISRSDIARVVHKELVTKKGIIRRKTKVTPAVRNICSRMKKNLPPRIFRVLKLVGSLADGRRCQAFAVGGFVRDLLLGVKNFDVDLVLEGEGLSFAKELADRLGGSLVSHRRFGTATVVTDWSAQAKRGPQTKREKFKIDIATARTEYYEYPAALPKVSFSSIKQDLYRRDFTINAMAVSLNRGRFGRLLDFFNGQQDLRTKKIRVLHDLSFVEDPTRIFRAVRFEQRYNFSIESHTEGLIKTAVSLDMFGRTQKQRLRDELILILSEPTPAKALLRMHQLHELRFIHPRLRLTKRMLRTFAAIDETCHWYRFSFLKKRPVDRCIIFFLAMIDDVSLPQVKALCEKFVFTKGDQKRIISGKRYANKIVKILDSRKGLSPSQIYRYLEPLSFEVILFIMAKARTQRAKERATLFFKEYNGVKLLISGRDLQALGIKPGPRYRKFLEKILYEKLDGRVKNKIGELNLAKRLSQRLPR